MCQLLALAVSSCFGLFYLFIYLFIYLFFIVNPTYFKKPNLPQFNWPLQKQALPENKSALNENNLEAYIRIFSVLDHVSPRRVY